ncbi:MAG: hypothetical protein RIQ60_3619 [Pseudomonadota bacterium]|jgi:pentapeptide MXKDX repeat protein
MISTRNTLAAALFALSASFAVHAQDSAMQKDGMAASDAMMKKADKPRKGAMKHDPMNKDGMAKDTMHKKPMHADGMHKDTMKKDAMAKDGMAKDEMKKDAMGK